MSLKFLEKNPKINEQVKKEINIFICDVLNIVSLTNVVDIIPMSKYKFFKRDSLINIVPEEECLVSGKKYREQSKSICRRTKMS